MLFSNGGFYNKQKLNAFFVIIIITIIIIIIIDRKRPDGLTLVPWSSGKAFCWDDTVTCPLADSYINAAAREPWRSGRASRFPQGRNSKKYADLDGRYTFEPIAIETLGVLNTSARQLQCDLGRQISENTGEVRETSFLFQRYAVLVQRFNAILLQDSLSAYDYTD